MPRTYKAILRGNRIEWSDDAPSCLAPEHAVAVQVTVLDEESLPTGSGLNQGQRMAAALEQLAAIHACAEMTDPAAWERDIREDRPLPDRDS
ncbi:MAG: hypothetical protein AB1611_03430 [bacterium]